MPFGRLTETRCIELARHFGVARADQEFGAVLAVGNDAERDALHCGLADKRKGEDFTVTARGAEQLLAKTDPGECARKRDADLAARRRAAVT